MLDDKKYQQIINIIKNDIEEITKSLDFVETPQTDRLPSGLSINRTHLYKSGKIKISMKLNDNYAKITTIRGILPYTKLPKEYLNPYLPHIWFDKESGCIKRYVTKTTQSLAFMGMELTNTLNVLTIDQIYHIDDLNKILDYILAASNRLRSINKKWDREEIIIDL